MSGPAPRHTMTLDDIRRIVAADKGLAIVSSVRQDGTVQASMVNAGVLQHPVTGEDVVGFVAVRESLKLRILRTRPDTAVTFRSGWEYVTVEGRAEVCGPDDPGMGIEGNDLRELLRNVFKAAGGAHEDWEAYDRAMSEERRACVLIRPSRIYGRRPPVSEPSSSGG